MVLKIKWKALLLSLLISLGVGGLSALFTSSSMQTYQDLVKPPLSPPGIVFGIVWTILFFLMGISAYLVYQAKSPNKKYALGIYGLQLIVNFFWSILFFNLDAYWFAFAWLILLWILILFMVILFYRICKLSGLLQIPYLLWVTFAGYLSFMVALLN